MFFAQSDPADITTANVLQRFPQIVADVTGDLGAFLPEIILCVGTCWVILFDLFIKKERSRSVAYHALAFLVLALVATLMKGFGMPEKVSIFRGMLVDDSFGTFMKVLMLSGSIICVPMVLIHRPFEGRRMGEFWGLLLASLVGMFLMVSTKNLLMLYLGVEFASITCYLLTAYVKNERPAAEGSLKYVIYGSVASGIMIYGLSLFYGMTGSLDISTISSQLVIDSTINVAALAAGLMAFAGFAYKIAAFPMHFWCPDVYHGAALPFTAFLSVVSKAAGFGVLIRFLWVFAQDSGYELQLTGGKVVGIDWPLVMAVVAALTMTIGNLAALFQENMKRLFAYSSVAHAGYLLMGAVALGTGGDQHSPGWQTIAYYLLVYLFMNLGAFLIVAIVANRTGKETMDAFTGLGKRNAMLAVCLLVFLVSLIGLPPTGGFTGKFQLLKVALENGYAWLAVIAGMNTAISVYYYWRIVKTMFLDETEDSSRLSVGTPMAGLVILLVIPIFYLGIFFSPAVEFIRGLELSLG